jgi:hypothetical protein
MHIPITLSIVVALSQTPGSAPKPKAAPAAQAPDALQLQVMLDRGGYSPAADDGRKGANTNKPI